MPRFKVLNSTLLALMFLLAMGSISRQLCASGQSGLHGGGGDVHTLIPTRDCYILLKKGNRSLHADEGLLYYYGAVYSWSPEGSRLLADSAASIFRRYITELEQCISVSDIKYKVKTNEFSYGSRPWYGDMFVISVEPGDAGDINESCVAALSVNLNVTSHAVRCVEEIYSTLHKKLKDVESTNYLMPVEASFMLASVGLRARQEYFEELEEGQGSRLDIKHLPGERGLPP